MQLKMIELKTKNSHPSELYLLKITFNINYKRWFYAMNLLSKKVYSPHQLQGLHLQGMSVWSDFKWSFLMCSLIIKRLTLLSVVVAAKTKRARNICAKVKRRKAKKVILYFNLKWFLFIFKQIHWGGTEKCYVHCIIVPHKPPPGSQLIFVCIFVTRESWAWKNCSACVISAPAHTGGFFSARASQILRGCSWVCKSHSVVSAAGISCVPHCMACCPGNCPPRINICSISRPLASVKVTSEMHHGKPRRTPGRSREKEGFTIIIPHHTRSRKLRPRMRLVFSLTELTN